MVTGNETVAVVVRSTPALTGLHQDAQRLAQQGSSAGQVAAALRAAAQALTAGSPSSRGPCAQQLKQLLQTQAPQA